MWKAAVTKAKSQSVAVVGGERWPSNAERE